MFVDKGTRVKDEDDFVDRFMYVFKAPIITWPMCDSITEDMRSHATLHRLAMIATAQKLDEASEYECLLYVMTSTLANPPSHTWYKIYMHLFCKFFPKQVGILGEGIEKPTEWELHELKDLQRWIFKKQMQAMKDKEKRQKIVVQEECKQLTLA